MVNKRARTIQQHLYKYGAARTELPKFQKSTARSTESMSTGLWSAKSTGSGWLRRGEGRWGTGSS